MARILFRRKNRARRGTHFAYSAWDGTQKGFDYDADSLFEDLADDLAYHGDLNAALRRAMQRGFEDRNGNQMPGLRDILKELAAKRQELLSQFDLGSVYDQIAEELENIVEEERDYIDDFTANQANDASTGEDGVNGGEPSEDGVSSDGASETKADKEAADRNLQLDMLRSDLPGRIQDLQQYQFMSSQAQQRFNDLIEKLRQEVTQSAFNQMRGAMGSMSGDDKDRTKDMLADLNEMLHQREAGEEPDFEGFMERHGNFFPENPQSLDELLETLAQRMAGMQAMFNSMSEEQRKELAQMMDQLMDDMDLQWQVQQLTEQLQQAFPDMGWDRQYDMSGQNPLTMSQATDVMGQLGELDAMSEILQGAVSPAALNEIDPEKIRELVGNESAEALERLSELAKLLEERGLASNEDGRLQLTPEALRRIGQLALRDLFDRLMEDKVGQHKIQRTGIGHERAYETKEYEFGDSFNLNIEQTLRNAVTRQGAGTPVGLALEDFEIEQTEFNSRASTVLMLDLSMSMPMRENFLPAKKVTMALHALISSRFPRDYLGVVGFAATARELKPAKLPEASWDFDYGTNMHHGFIIARRLLAKQSGSKQIIMITDGEPTAHLKPNGAPFFAYPPVHETIEATLKEVARATREDIRINVFMLEPNSYLRTFVEKMTQMNGGRAFFTSPHNLGDYVLVDFLEHRRRLTTSNRRL